MVVRRSIEVANNLTCSVPSHPGPPGKGTPPVGLLVAPGTSHITIDLNGHTLSGPRVPGRSRDRALGHSVEMVGIQLGRARDVTVTDGTIRHFDAGVSDVRGDHNRFIKLKVFDNRSYQVVNGAIDYLPPPPTLNSVAVAGTVSSPTIYAYRIATAQAPNPVTTPGDNGIHHHSYTQDSLLSDSKSVTNNATLAAGVNYNTITFTGVAPAFATGYRIIRSINGGPSQWIATLPASVANTYTFVDEGQTPASQGQYRAVTLENQNASVDDTCNSGDGIVLDASNHDTVTNDNAVANGPYSGIAIVDRARYNYVANNKLLQNAVVNLDPGYNNPHNKGARTYCGAGPGAPASGHGRLVADSGVRIEGPGAQHNLVEHNLVSGSGFNGIAIHSWLCRRVGRTRIGAPNSFNTVSRNTVSNTGKYTPSGDETNLDGIGILASGVVPLVCVSPDNRVTDNNSHDNVRDGIFLGGHDSSGNYIAGNTVHSNAGNGIEAEHGGTGYGRPPNRLRGNRGYGNHNYDGFDGNSSCNGNIWSANGFKRVNQGCVR